MGEEKPYPGYKPSGTSDSPRPVGRVKPEAEQFAQQAKGSLVLTYGVKGSTTPRPDPRCQGEDARSNYNAAQGSVVKLLGGSVPRLKLGTLSARSPRDGVVARVKPEAAPIADAHIGKKTAELFHKQGTLPLSPPPAPRVKPEADEIAEEHKGGRMKCLVHSPKRLAASPKAVPRIKPEAGKTAELGAGVRMKKYIHKYATPLSSRAVPRIKPEADDIAKSHEGRLAAKLFTSYGNQTPSARAQPRIKPEAEEIAAPHKGDRMKCLVQSPSRLPQSPPAVPRVKDDAIDNAELNKGGQVNSLIYEYGTPLTSRPRSRVRPEAEEFARKSQGTMAVLMGNYGRMPLSARPAARVTSSGEDIFSKSQGRRMSYLMHGSKRRG